MHQKNEIQQNQFLPVLFTMLRKYTFQNLKGDFFAGLTVSIIALPLAMALAIASGAPPERGLFTAIIAGLAISFFGGSRFQISGPTAAFIVVVSSIINQYDYSGLVIATFLAGIFLIIIGFLRFGNLIKYIPHPVINGFTAGIAIVIFISQLKDLFGLPIDSMPTDFFEKITLLFTNFSSLSWEALCLSVSTVTIILFMRKMWPNSPAFLVAIVVCCLLTAGLGLSVETIGSRFGELPSSLPKPNIPENLWVRIVELLPSALIITFLGALESLLSAVIADDMTNTKHKPNCELVAQGIGNMLSGLFGGMPATGAIARTNTNIRAGANSPLSGIFHAVFIFIFMCVLAPFAEWVPLSALAATLLIIAWNMLDFKGVIKTFRSKIADSTTFLTTFSLTILTDITIAVTAGLACAFLFFTSRKVFGKNVKKPIEQQ